MTVGVTRGLPASYCKYRMPVNVTIVSYLSQENIPHRSFSAVVRDAKGIARSKTKVGSLILNGDGRRGMLSRRQMDWEYIATVEVGS